jgi:hypothetical protein
VLSVDIGRTATKAVIGRPGDVEVFSIGEQRSWVPSLIAVTGQGVVTGDAASRRAVEEPAIVVRGFVDEIGNDEAVAGRGQFGASDLAAKFVRSLVDEATAHLGTPPVRVALVLRASMSEASRSRLLHALLAAEVPEPRLLPSPVAAAAYSIQGTAVADGEIVVVYDLGGESFAASLLVAQGGEFALTGHGASLELGGVDLDQSLLDAIVAALGERWTTLDFAQAETFRHALELRSSVTAAREALSTDEQTTIVVRGPYGQYEVQVTRDQLEQQILRHVRRTADAIQELLVDANVAVSSLRSVVLAGGAARTPLVAQMLSAIGVPLFSDTNAQFVPSMGAAMLAVQDLGPSPVVRAAPSGAPATPVTGPEPAASPAAATDGGRPSVAVAALVVEQGSDADEIAATAVDAPAPDPTLRSPPEGDVLVASREWQAPPVAEVKVPRSFPAPEPPMPLPPPPPAPIWPSQPPRPNWARVIGVMILLVVLLVALAVVLVDSRNDTGSSGAVPSASCLIGTWEVDTSATQRGVSLSGFARVTFANGRFHLDALAFTHKENGDVVATLNGSGDADYEVDGNQIRISNATMNGQPGIGTTSIFECSNRTLTITQVAPTRLSPSRWTRTSP